MSNKSGSLSVTLLSKALVFGPYQRKAELIAAEPDISLTVIAPLVWRDGARLQRLEHAHTRGYRLLGTRVIRPGDFHLHFYPWLGRMLDELRPDVVHIDEEPYNVATFLALRAARARGARTLFFTWQNLYRKYPPPFSFMERFVHQHVDGAIAGSQSAAHVLARKGFNRPVAVLPQVGVDPDVYSPAPDRPTGRRLGPRADWVPGTASGAQAQAHGVRPGNDGLAIGFVGRLVPAKGVDVLIEALTGLPTGWRLDVVGDGPARPALERLAAKRGVRDFVRFRSWLPGAQLPDFYRSLDVLVLPSRSTPAWVEQFGRVLVEAMACRVACVGSDCGEIPHVLGPAGIVFPAGDAAALGAILARLAARPEERLRLGRLGRRRVLQRFTMSRIATETAAIYRTLAAQPGLRGRPERSAR